MKLAYRLACGIALACSVALTGCNNDDDMSTTTVSPGAVETCDGCNQPAAEGCCASKAACPFSGDAASDAAPGAVGDSECSSKKSDCASQCSSSGDAAPGAVSDSDCSSKKSNCASQCPSSGDAAPGAVSETKTKGCCSQKSG